ncbi:uncharacterized protein F5Z01DRAFT_291414 [Emericellopsis atlantica]|uniref:Class E vacuolar protein-sorting machinery protein HSE1 n=1 Tax=Emericellopsis atlantica TaxID=2614577 RepID=A0A9P7ZG15_9HYPO|nr:uncharacterized protein F5Z01DRAFT_291414 [Emericellopsis atlantica]KAG9251305.1 hypothetical protein F5Z01DRAFT_291414 [Emericellopsis atlantica]
MFRAAATSPYDDVVAKATDEKSTSEDWGAILEVCDKVTTDTNGPKEVVQSMIRRLAHRNANVQLYTLELAHALCQNCGKPVHREISSRAFTDALLKLANDRNTHAQVKGKILEKMKDWSDMFSKDQELGIMYDAYYRLKQNNPTLQPPSAPQKQGLTATDRQKEEDELQMALKLSLQEEERKKAPSGSAQAGPSGQQQQQGQQQDPTPAPAPQGTTAATVSRVRALYDFTPSEPGELEFKRGDVIAVLESVYKDWWRGSLKGKTGIFPLNYVEKLTDPTPDELQREAQMEAEVFAEIKNVEKLLTLLSTSNSAPREEDNEEISLYHQTLAIRPKLIKLIEKYSQKKDDFTQLNEKFIKARRDYEALLESSMSHPPQHSYQQYPAWPGAPGQGYPQAPGGHPQPQGHGPPPGHGQHDPQRFYTPGPSGPSGPHQAASPPPPNFPQQGTPAPFYVAGSEVPSSHGQRPPAGQQYPPHDDPSHQPPSGHQHAASHNTSSPPPPQQYNAYGQPPGPQSPGFPQQQGRPQSTYGAQELATSVYDSPIAPPNNLQPTKSWTNSAYAPDDDQNQKPSAPPPQQGGYAPQYQPYNAAPPDHPPPPAPEGMAPPPLQPGGAAYDARQSFSGQPAGQAPAQQYKPYVPPGGGPDMDAPSAPAPNDYYRSGVY